MKNIFKTLSVMTLVASLSISLISCGNDTTEKESKRSPSKVVDDVKSSSDASVEDVVDDVAPEYSFDFEDEAVEDDATASSGDISIPSTTIFDKGNIKITITGYSVDEFWGDQITYTVENNSDKDIVISSDTTIINGFEVVDGLYESVPAGKKANGEISVDPESFVSDAGVIEMYLDIYDGETYEDIFVEEYVSFETSAASRIEEDYVIEGDLIYDENGIKIISCGMEYDEIWGYEVKLYIENNSDKVIVYDASDASVNDIMFDEWLYNILAGGNKCFETVTLYESDIEELNIEEIEKIDIVFQISDYNFYDLIDEFTAVIYEK